MLHQYRKFFIQSDDPLMINVFPLRVISLYIRKISYKATHSSSRLSNGTQYNGRIVRTAQRTLLIKSFRNDFSLPFLFIFISFFIVFYLPRVLLKASRRQTLSILDGRERRGLFAELPSTLYFSAQTFLDVYQKPLVINLSETMKFPPVVLRTTYAAQNLAANWLQSLRLNWIFSHKS